MGVYLGIRDFDSTYEIIMGEENKGTIRGESYKMFCIRAEDGLQANGDIRLLSGLWGIGKFTERYPKISIIDIFKHGKGNIYFVQRYVDDIRVKRHGLFDASKDNYIELDEYEIRQIPATLNDHLLSQARENLHDSERNIIIEFLLERTVRGVASKMSLSMLESL
jgi:hypothetical protein